MIRVQKMRSYAEALLRLASETSSTMRWCEQAGEIRQILKQNPRFVQIVADGQFDLLERKQLIDNVFATSQDFDRQLVFFLKVLVDNGVFSAAIAILHIFMELADQANNVKYVKIYSAFPLCEEEIKRFQKSLVKKLGFAQILIKNVVDPKLICGAKVVTESLTIDNTLKGKMDLVLKKILALKIN